MHIEITTLFGIIGGIIGIIGFFKGIKKEGASTGSEITAIKSNVDYIVRGIDDIRLEQREQARKIDNQNERLIRNEEAVREMRVTNESNFKELRKRIEKLEDE